MSVPFIRMNPDGKRSLQEVIRDPKVEEKAAEFIDAAGRYLIEIRKDGLVHILAIIDKADGCQVVASEEVENGPKLLDAVDRLVKESVQHIPIRVLTPHAPHLTVVK